MAGIIVDFCSTTGPLTQLVGAVTGNYDNLLGNAANWRPYTFYQTYGKT